MGRSAGGPGRLLTRPRSDRPSGRCFDRRTRARGFAMSEPTATARPIRELVQYYLWLGLLGFGGPVALVGQMERELVTERGWLTREQMREAIAVCQSMPGPLAIQVGIFVAYLRAGQRGAWAGGWAFSSAIRH